MQTTNTDLGVTDRDLKKIVILFISVVMIIVLNSPERTHAGLDQGHKVIGEIVKVEGPFVTVKDQDGKSHKFHVNKSTHIKGMIKIGSRVVVESNDTGHAISISMNALES